MMPSCSSTIAIRFFTMALKSADLPTLGRPIMAMFSMDLLWVTMQNNYTGFVVVEQYFYCLVVLNFNDKFVYNSWLFV